MSDTQSEGYNDLSDFSDVDGDDPAKPVQEHETTDCVICRGLTSYGRTRSRRRKSSKRGKSKSRSRSRRRRRR